MNDAAKVGARLLTGAEAELVAVTRPPEIERQSVDELKVAVRRLREAHDRAKGIGTRQAREMRGKAEPHGVKLAQDNWARWPRRRLCARRWIGWRRSCAAATRRLNRASPLGVHPHQGAFTDGQPQIIICGPSLLLGARFSGGIR